MWDGFVIKKMFSGKFLYMGGLIFFEMLGNGFLIYWVKDKMLFFWKIKYF